MSLIVGSAKSSFNPYLIPSNLTTCSFTPGNPDVALLATSQGDWGTFTTDQMAALGAIWASTGGSQPINLNQILGVPFTWPDMSNYGLRVNSFGATNGVLIIKSWSPFGTQQTTTIDCSTAFPAGTDIPLFSKIEDITFYPNPAWVYIGQPNICFLKLKLGISKVFIPDPKTTSWITSIQVFIDNVPNVGAMTYTALQSNDPLPVWKNTSVVSGGPSPATDYPNLPAGFEIGAPMIAATNSQLMAVPFGVNNIWVTFTGVPTSYTSPPIFNVTLLQNGRWNT